MRIKDQVTPVEDILYKAPAIFRLKDTATVQDTLRATTTKPIFDSATVDDVINIVDIVRILDEVTPVEDILYKAPAIFRLKDTATVQDNITWTVTMRFGDTITVDDDIKTLI